MTVDAVWYYSSSPTGRLRARLWSSPMTGYGFIVQGRWLAIDLLIDQNPWLSSEWHAHRARFMWRKTSLIEADELFIDNWLIVQRYQLTTTTRLRQIIAQQPDHLPPSEWDYFLLLLYAFQFGVRLTPLDLHRFNEPAPAGRRQFRQLTLDFRPLERNQFAWRENLAWSAAEAIGEGPGRPDRSGTTPESLTESIVVDELVSRCGLVVAGDRPTTTHNSVENPNWITDDQLSDLMPEEVDVDDLRRRLHLVAVGEVA